MSFSAQRIFELEVTKGNIAGHSPLDKYGVNFDIDTSAEDIWAFGGLYSGFITSSGVAQISSSSTADTSAGTGARTVEVFGLDASWNYQSETVTMNGTSNVVTSGTYFRIFRMRVVTAGSGFTNAGNISALIGGNRVAYIRNTAGSTEQAIYSIATGHTLYLDKISFQVEDDKFIDAELRVNKNLDTARTTFINANYRGISDYNYNYNYLSSIQGPADIYLRATAGANNTEVSGQITGIIVQD